MRDTKTVCVVGGGVIGLCVAYYLQRRGDHIVLVERGAPTHDGCSLGNAGMIVPSHIVPLAAPGMVSLGLRMMANPQSPFYIRPRLNRDLFQWGWQFLKSANAANVDRAAPLLRDLNLASRKAYEELADEFGNEFSLVKKGLLMLCKTQVTLDEEAETAHRAQSLGIPAEVLTPEETAQLDPAIRIDIAGSIYFPKDCHLSPHHFTSRLTRELERNGAEFRWNTEAIGWQKRDTHLKSLQTREDQTGSEIVGEIHADEFVLAGGAWSPKLARSLRLSLPMQAGKGYSLTLTKPRQLPTICSILTEARVAITPMGDTLRIGGTMEIAGLDETVNPRRVKGITDAVPRYFPQFKEDDFADLPVWKGLRPCSPDGLPYIGRAQAYDNLTIATGHAMMGLSLAPITGQLVTALLANETPKVEMTLLRPDRFV